jgi:prophage maintenance system killer protein
MFRRQQRCGVAAALFFLKLNGVSTDFGSEPLYDAMIASAERRMDKVQLAGVFRTLFAQSR